MLSRSCVFVVLVCLVSMSRAEDWPEFRGPTGQGLSAEVGLPIEWSETKNVAWKQAVPGKGWSSPIVVGGKVYLTTAAPRGGDGKPEDLSLDALCLDAKSGRILWEQEVFRQDPKASPSIHGKNSHASSTPLIHGQRLFVHFGHQGTACLDLDGKVLWRNSELKYAPVHGNGGSPIYFENLLLFSCDGGDKRFVAALEASTGKVAWQTERTGDAAKKFSFSTPLLIHVNDKPQLISAGSDVVCSYDPKTGREIWRVRYDGYSVIPRPVFGHGLLFLSTSYNTPSLLAIRPDGEGDITSTNITWSSRKAIPHTPSPLLVGDELYLVSDNGQASCVDAKTGKVHWQERLNANFSASPVYAEGRIYLQSEQGIGFVLQASKEFKQLAKNTLEARTLASYAIAEGAIFLRTDKHLYRLQK